MKSFIALVALIAVAVASPVTRFTSADEADLAAIIAAIHSPSTDPATAAILEQQLQQILGLEPIVVGPAIVGEPSPIVVGPAIVDNFEPIVVGPALVEFPAVVESPAPVIVDPSPVPVAESNSAPLVQIILNIKQAESSAVVPPGVAILPEIVETPVVLPAEPVIIVDSAPEAVQVVDTLPVQIVDAPTIVEPVVVVETAPVPVEPVVVAPPVLPSPVITLPEQQLN